MGFIEAVYLVYEKYFLLPESKRPFVPTLAEYLFYVLLAGIYRGKFVEIRTERIRIQFRERRFPASRRSPKNEREKLFLFHSEAQGFPFSYEMLLAEEFGERLRTYP